MKHIEKITINNARRLGENTEINFGAGATIVLAPNGTGKTTIFEAIELALTGRVKRVESCLDAIIRDRCDKMSVRLDFSKGKFCMAEYVRGQGCVTEGNYKELFGFENNMSVPYLFRLTHFLEQRCDEWFVSQDDNEAGDRLYQLPIGKDLQNIISKRTSFLRAIGVTETDAVNALSKANEDLIKFVELQTKRDGLIIDTALTPLKVIMDKILSIRKLTNYKIYNGIYDVSSINTYMEQVKISFKQESDIRKDLLVKLNSLKERVPLYVSNQQIINNKQKIVDEYLEKACGLRINVEQTKKYINEFKVELASIRDEINKLEKDKSMYEEAEKKSLSVSAKKAEIEQNENLLINLRNSYKATDEYVNNQQRLQEYHRIINESIEKKRLLLTQTELKREVQRQWQELSKVNHEISNYKIPEIEKKKNQSLLLKSQFEREVSEAEKVYLQKKNVLNSLNKAAGAIQDAVSNIRKHLAEDQGCCPVCQANYEPDDLFQRIELSLRTINPSIPSAIEEEKNALLVLEIAQKTKDQETKKLLELEFELNAEKRKLEANERKTIEIFLPQFSGSKNPEEASIYIEELIDRITSQIIELEVSKSSLDQVPIEELNNAILRRNMNQKSILELTTRNEKLQYEIVAETERINSICNILKENNKNEVITDIFKKSTLEKERKDSVQNAYLRLTKFEENLKEYEGMVLNENELISKLKGGQESIYTEWKHVELEGQPNEDELKIKCEACSSFIHELEQANLSLNAIEQELVSWRTAEKLHQVEKDIKEKIGDHSENTYLAILRSCVAEKNNTLLKIQEKRKAINLFLSKVAIGSKQIHTQLNSINEPWKKLLKRIVINPLIATAPLLSNATLRNKPIAKTSAIIHEQETNIVNIASEAQLTDLQLTLTLAMANKYQWTPWKALLLDDPTQHHDLVHASSVFDVLRDYIMDLDYQILMSTHDSIQARFFQRKLDNEGINSKVYQLVSRKSGVTAERIV